MPVNNAHVSLIALAERSMVGDDRSVLVLEANLWHHSGRPRCWEKMLEANSGSLVNVSSASGSAAYKTSKHDSIGLIRTIAAAWGDQDVWADAVCQGCSRKWPAIGCARKLAFTALAQATTEFGDEHTGPAMRIPFLGTALGPPR